MSPLLNVLLFALAILMIVTLIDVVRRGLGLRRTVAWVLIVVLVPFAGSVLYWVLRDKPLLSPADGHGARGD